MSRLTRIVAALPLLAATICAPGCTAADPDEIPAVPAAGTVTYRGQPLEAGTVQTLPERGRPATGKIEHGRFRLSTYAEGDGALPGRARVGVVSVQEVPSKSKKDSDPDIKYLVPEKYASPSSSGLQLEIPREGSTELRIEIP